MRGGGTRKRHRDEMPEKRLLQIAIDILQRRDIYEIFAQPVDPNEVEGYCEIVKEPMDLGTMRAKLHEGMYRNLDEFKYDVFLITRNAMHFNSPSTIYFKQARAMHDLAKRIFHTLLTHPQNLESKFLGTRRRSTRIRPPTPCSPQPPTTGEPLLETDRRCTYTCKSSEHGNENQLIPTGEQDVSRSYRKSLWLFARDLGPTAKMMAMRKMRAAEEVDATAKKMTCAGAVAGEVDDGGNKDAVGGGGRWNVIPVVLALEHSQPNANEYSKTKSRNKKPLTNTTGALQTLEALMEEPTTAFTFNLAFLKAQLHKMNTPTTN